MINLSSGLFEMAGQQIEEEDLEAASKDIMATIDEDGDGDVTKVQSSTSFKISFLCYHKILFSG